MIKRVLYGGFFDLLHLGQVLALKEAKKLGYLIVHVASDKEAKNTKGVLRPIIPGEERAALVKELKCVDEVFYTDYYMTDEEVVKATKADIIIRNKGSSNEFSCEVVYFDRHSPKSGLDTSKIIKKIKSMPNPKELAGINYILKVNNKILLQRRDNKPGIRCPGMLVIPGGKLEVGENPHLAAVREIREETNLDLHPDKLNFVCDFTYPWGETNRFFMVELDHQPIIQSGEGKTEWWEIKEIPELAGNQNKIIELYL